MVSDGEMEASTQPPVTEMANEDFDNSKKYFSTIDNAREPAQNYIINDSQQPRQTSKMPIAVTAIDGDSECSEYANLMTKRPESMYKRRSRKRNGPVPAQHNTVTVKPG